MNRIYFETEFKNKRKESVHVHEGGKMLCIVPPGESHFEPTVPAPTGDEAAVAAYAADAYKMV